MDTKKKLSIGNHCILLAACVLSAVFASSAAFAQKHGWWGHTEYKGKPWVKNVSKDVDITRGLQGRHISLWASHGRYFANDENKWKWQRVNLFGTNEDLLTQTFVVPFLIPMLENAGACVFTPRERDWQMHEIVVDNDNCMKAVDGMVLTNCTASYIEDGKWQTIARGGFRIPDNYLVYDGDMPFSQGTSRCVATKKRRANAFAIYTPEFTVPGRYAVYVSYQTYANSVDDAHYIVMHRGVETHFHVNQKMGSGTWVYLGTFDFDVSDPMLNCVIVDNQSKCGGVVSTDAVRFGGGMGNVVRGNKLSGFARSFEGARYYAQWAGLPYSLYSQRNSTNDYADDINVRSFMTNWLAGGSCFVPNQEGKNVPIELSLGVHSDAGFNKDMQSVFGSLGICTTDFNDGRLASGYSRENSSDFAEQMLYQISSDLGQKYGKWNVRDLYDKNYSETRLPGMPSSIIEMFSHESFPDMALAHDPQFKFDISRAIYKAILSFVSESHNAKFAITPLAPKALRMTLDAKGKLNMSWSPTADPLEKSAKTESYMLYVAKGTEDFGNGIPVSGSRTSLRLDPYTLYRFRVTACNSGGESFPSEEMAAVYIPNAQGQILVVNGFHRVAGPAVKRTVNHARNQSPNIYSQLLFDMNEDPGVPYGRFAGWSGQQQVSDVSTAGKTGPGMFGYCGEELAGKYIAGNTFDYVSEHAKAIMTANKYSVVSCSSDCLGGIVELNDYNMVDVILGNERSDGYTPRYYKTFTPEMMRALRNYNGGLLVSGSYVGSDNRAFNDSLFVSDVLHTTYYTQNRSAQSTVSGLGTTMDVYRMLNDTHYASTASDVLLPTNGAYAAMSYADGMPAAIAFENGRTRTFTMGFPFECITDDSKKALIMRGIVSFLIR